MNENLHLSHVGGNIIKSYESLQLKAYVDTIKHGLPDWAIGYGHTNSLGAPEVHEGMVIDEQQADEIFYRDALIFEKKVKNLIFVPLTQNQFDALVCFAYNASTDHFKEMLANSKLNEGVYDKVPEALMKYVVSRGRTLRGLIRRRKEEGDLWNKG